MCSDKSMADYLYVDTEFSLDERLNTYFDLYPEMDDDGFQHILIPTQNLTSVDQVKKLRATTLPLETWLTSDLSNMIILSFKSNNELSITWRDNDVTRLEIKSAKVKSFRSAKTPHEVIELIIGEFSNALLSIKANPQICVDMSII